MRSRYSGCHDVTALQSWGETIPLVCRAVVLRQQKVVAAAQEETQNFASLPT